MAPSVYDSTSSDYHRAMAEIVNGPDVPPLRVYVAAAFAEHPRARTAMAAIREAGAVVTHDWTALADVYPNDDAPAHLRAQHAAEDLDGVRTADVVLVLTPEDRSRGAGLWVEMGAALALGRPVVIVGEQRHRNVFCARATPAVSDFYGVQLVLEYARAPRRCGCAEVQHVDERRHFKGCARHDLYPAGEVDPEIVRLRAWAEASDAYVRAHAMRCGRDDCDAPATHYTWALVGPWRYRCEEHREQPVDGRRDSEEEGVATWLRARAGLATERP